MFFAVFCLLLVPWFTTYLYHSVIIRTVPNSHSFNRSEPPPSSPTCTFLPIWCVSVTMITDVSLFTMPFVKSQWSFRWWELVLIPFMLNWSTHFSSLPYFKTGPFPFSNSLISLPVCSLLPAGSEAAHPAFWNTLNLTNIFLFSYPTHSIPFTISNSLVRGCFIYVYAKLEQDL